MIVQCPNCNTTYNFEDDMVKSGGVKAKCTVCDHVFVVTPESDVSKKQVEEEQVEETSAAVEEAEAPKTSRGSRESAEDDDIVSSDDELSMNLDESPKKKKAKGGKKVMLAVLVLILLLAGGAAGVYFFAPNLIPGLAPTSEESAPEAGTPEENMESAEAESPQAPAETTESEPESAAPEKEAEREIEEVANVQNIILADIRQYYVDNDKAGRIFVVEGNAVNDFDQAKQHVEVSVSLLDAEGQSLAQKDFLAGNTLDLYGLQNLSREKIEQALSDKLGIASRNMNVEPGKSVPFMAVFFDPPAGLREFLVKVTDVESPS